MCWVFAQQVTYVFEKFAFFVRAPLPPSSGFEFCALARPLLLTRTDAQDMLCTNTTQHDLGIAEHQN